MSSLVYVYAVLPGPATEQLTGIDARPVRYVSVGRLSAAVSEVTAQDFEEQPLNERVRDMGWLGPRAMAHQEVNSRLHELTHAMIPLAFGTIFRDEARVKQLLLDQQSELAQRLEKVRGCAEWVIALHQLAELDAEAIARSSAAIQALRSEIASSSVGRAHLLGKRLATLERDEARRLRNEAGTALLARLGEVIVDSYSEPLPADTVERPLVRASVLVRRRDEVKFLETVDRLRAEWPEPTYRLLLTGPWPPYRFAGLKAEYA